MLYEVITVLVPAPLRPRWLDRPEAIARLGRIRDGLTLEAIAAEAVETPDD